MENMQVSLEVKTIEIVSDMSCDSFVEQISFVFSDIVGNYWADSPLSVLPIYKGLTAAGVKLWVFW